MFKYEISNIYRRNLFKNGSTKGNKKEARWLGVGIGREWKSYKVRVIPGSTHPVAPHHLWLQKSPLVLCCCANILEN